MAQKKNMPLAGYRVLLCVTGGVACYKSADLASKLTQAGAEVDVAMTEAAQKFVGQLTFQAVTHRAVHTSLWQSLEDYSTQHVSLTEQADLMVVAPATANIIGKMANGLADDLVSTLALSASGACPILIAPAMNTRMWSSQVVQENFERLNKVNVESIGPVTGRLACGTIGPGRMSEPADIFEAIKAILLNRPPKKR